MTQGLLNPVHLEAAAPHLPAPRYALSLKGEVLSVEFSIERSEPYVNPALPFNRSADKLWEHDVVEVFISLGQTVEEIAHAPYLEFQISPLGQFFELRIHEPRKRVDVNPQLGLVAAVDSTPHQWNAHFEIPLGRHFSPVRQDRVFGNLFSILGPPGKKEFWSLFTPPQSRPDFHIREHFKRLLIEG